MVRDTLRVLVADDSSSALRFMEEALGGVAEVTEAVNGLEAVRCFAAAMELGRTFDAVFMDIMMPEVDGLTAVKKIRRMESAAEVPPERRAGIVMLSSLSDAKHMMEAQYECGADLYLTKPVERDTLLEALANLGLTVGPFMENDRIPPKS